MKKISAPAIYLVYQFVIKIMIKEDARSFPKT